MAMKGKTKPKTINRGVSLAPKPKSGTVPVAAHSIPPVTPTNDEIEAQKRRAISAMIDDNDTGLSVGELIEIARSPSAWEFAVIQVGPELAAALIKANIKNRRPRWGHVTKLSRDMENGRWRLTPQPLIISRSGALIDGQHRLYAVIRSGVTCEFSVVSNVDEEIYKSLDQGSRRMFSDRLIAESRARGEGDEPEVREKQAVLMRLWEWRTGLLGSPHKESPTQEELQETREHCPGWDKGVKATRGFGRTFKGISRSGVSACYYFFSLIDQAAADVFIHSLLDGSGLPSGNAILALRERFIRTSTRTEVRHIPHEETMGLVIKAWNAWRKGDTGFRAVFRVDEAFPAIDGFDVRKV